MKIINLIIFIMVFIMDTALADSKSCEDAKLTDVENLVLKESYLTKVNESIKPKKSIFGLRRELLYCSKSLNSDSCEYDGVWFTFNQFVKFKASYREVTCAYSFNNLSVVNGVETRSAGILYYTKKP